MLADAVKIIDAFGAWVGKRPFDLSIAPKRAFADTVSGSIQQFGDSAFAPVLQEQFVGLPANRGFIRLNDKLPVFPLKAVGCHAVDGLAELGPEPKLTLSDGRRFPLVPK